MSLISLQEDTKPTNNCSSANRACPQWPIMLVCHIFTVMMPRHCHRADCFYRCYSKTWAEAKVQSQPSTSCPVIFCGSTPLTTPGESKRSQRNSMLPGTASTIGEHRSYRWAVEAAAVFNHGCYSGCASINQVSHIWLINIYSQSKWPLRPAGQWAEGSADVSQRAGVFPQMAPGGGDYSQRPGRRLPEGRPVAGLRPRQGAEATTGGRAANRHCESVPRCQPIILVPSFINASFTSRAEYSLGCVWVHPFARRWLKVCEWEGIQRACECLYASSAAHWSSCPMLLRNSVQVRVCVRSSFCVLLFVSLACHLPRPSLRDALTHIILCFM